MKLSIITINKDNAKGLERTALSVIWQTFTDFEWIVIDGASNDNSVEIIKKYAHKMVYWVSEPDTGVYNAMNKGIKQAKGDYCLFLNSGDWLFSPDILETVFLEIKDKQADIFYGDYLFKDFSVWKVPETLFMDFFYPNNSISHQNSIIRRSLFINHEFYSEDYKTISDSVFFMKELYQYHSVFFYIRTKMSINDFFGLSQSNCGLSLQEQPSVMRKIMGDNEYNAMVAHCSYVHVKQQYSSVKLLRKITNYVLPYGIVKIVKKLLKPAKQVSS